MNLFQAVTLLALLVNLLLGFMVLRMNPARKANRNFFVSSLAFDAWLLCLVFGSLPLGKQAILFWIRQSHPASALLPLVIDLLRLSIAHEELPPRQMFRELRPFVLLVLAVLVLAQAPFFVQDFTTSASGFPRPVFGWGQGLYVAYWLVALALLVHRFTCDFWTARGITKTELQFLLLSFVAAAIMGVSVGHVIPMLTGNRDIIQLMPLGVVLMAGIIAYGIVTQRIMSVGTVLRRVTAYALLAAYLSTLYFVVLFVGFMLLQQVTHFSDAISHLLATLAVAFTMSPAHGILQRVAQRIFINIHPLDLRNTLSAANEALMLISTVDDLMSRFAEITSQATGTDSVSILLEDRDVFRQAYPPDGDRDELPIRIEASSPLPELLRSDRSPVSADALRRIRRTEVRRGALDQLQKASASVAVGVWAGSKLKAALLLGPRLSGRIYGADDLDALQFLCNNLGVALDNARLYTEVQNGKLYNEILLDSILSGIVAADADRMITVFNREAKRITGLATEEVLGKPVSVLPEVLARALESSIANGSGVLDSDVILEREDEEDIPIRYSASVYSGHMGEQQGAILVFSDMSLVRKLEQQVRRTDRLASLGTLSAGMAHEIKNPLVSLKTFAQLLPERYDDPEFRDTFSKLLGKEVTRIDAIVNRLLHFARPAKAQLVPIHLHEVVRDAVHLIGQQLKRRNISLSLALDASDDSIRGDADLLGQAVVNFLLNAVEAMDKGGQLAVSTQTIRDKRLDGVGKTPLPSFVRLSVRDSGSGIAEEDIPRVFDPFYTTKTNGTGLGLSVSHGIIQEHSATVEVESALGAGTVFHLTFPVDREPAEAA